MMMISKTNFAKQLFNNLSICSIDIEKNYDVSEDIIILFVILMMMIMISKMNFAKEFDKN